MRNEIRHKSHQKQQEVEALLKDLQAMVLHTKYWEKHQFNAALDYPVILIMGCARSGSTLLYQYLASTGLFSYPSNLMSRFYYAPYFGAKLHRLLIDLDLKGEIFGQGAKSFHFQSELGKTTGAHAPHEFWYFWRRFFKFPELQQLDKNELSNADSEAFLRGLNEMQMVFPKPLLMKGMIMNWHIPYLAELSNKIFFIHIKRNIEYNAQSLLEARKKFFGSTKEWYSFKPPQYLDIKDKTPEEQVVMQVAMTNDAIEEGLKKIGPHRSIEVDYNSFCRYPYHTLKNTLDMIDYKTEGFDERQVQFEASDEVKLPPDQWANIRAAVKSL